MKAHRHLSLLAIVSLASLLLLPFGCSGSGGGGSGAAKALNPLIDFDSDGLRDEVELRGWMIRVDRSGYGPSYAEAYTVFSNPNAADSDGDGLTDKEEHRLRTDPNDPDTDADGLTDYAEVNQWLTNPISVDTDGDARGPAFNLAPNPKLFDGEELTRLKTSPTLADTDGDARTDYEEFDNPVFNPRIAELPEAEIVVDGDIDVRLNVQYAESLGKTKSYGGTISKGKSKSTSIGYSSTLTGGVKLSASTTIGAKSTPPGGSAGVTIGGEVSLSKSGTSSSSVSEAETFQESSSRQQSDSRTLTETSASGTISLPLRIKNSGASTFTLTDLAVSVMHWAPGQTAGTGSMKVVATIESAIKELTLSPGSQTPILQVANTQVNTDVIKEFLARPNGLLLQPPFFNLRNKDGVNFDFLTEKTQRRTALVVIEFGDKSETYRVATNVQRLPDSSRAGVKMSEAMQSILGFKKGDAIAGYTVQERKDRQSSKGTGVFVLTSVRGKKFIDNTTTPERPLAYWGVISSNPAHAAPKLSFEDIVLRAGDEVRLVYCEDADGDAVYDFEEDFYGTESKTTSVNNGDTDGDKLKDGEETKTGWEVTVLGVKRRVYSNPKSMDSDGDGWDDKKEFDNKTDPTRADTDGDGLRDDVDPFPLDPATRLHVDAALMTAGDGSTWAKAMKTLDAALAAALAKNTDSTKNNDIAEIWVAPGTYTPTTSFTLVNNVSVYGGFIDGGIKRGARDPDPRSNGTILEGKPTAAVVLAPGKTTMPAVSASTVLDGFTIQEGRQGLHSTGGHPTLRNLLFFKNENNQQSSSASGAGISLTNSPSRRTVLIEDCYFINNEVITTSQVSLARGSAIFCASNFDVTVRRSSFTSNFCRGTTKFAQNLRGTVYYSLAGGRLEMSNCRFSANLAGRGSALYADKGSAFLTDCDIIRNEGDRPVFNNLGAALAMTNCRLWNNKGQTGGAVETGGDFVMTNCTVAGHQSTTDKACIIVVSGRASFQNCIFWGNTNGAGKNAQLLDTGSADLRVDHSNFENDVAVNSGTGNIEADPLFRNLKLGDLRLGEFSACIDAGLNIVDIDPKTPGRQMLPTFDLDGNLRIFNGDRRGAATVDMGCYEFQGK